MFDDIGVAGTPEGPEPYPLEAEKATLGAILADPTLFDRAREQIVDGSLFYRLAHVAIWSAFVSLAGAGTPIDLITVTAELKRRGQLEAAGGPAYISALADGMPRAANVAAYVDQVRVAGDARRLSRACRNTIEALSRDPSAVRNGVPGRLRDALERAAEANVEEPAIEPIGQIAARLDVAPAPWLVDGLVPPSGRLLLFGQERCFKSIAARELAVAVASGRPAFGLARLRVTEGAPVVIVTEEDSEAAVFGHLDAFADGRARDLPIYLSACRGLSLDDPAVQDRLVRQIEIAGARLVIFEPLRSLTQTVDKTAADVAPLARFLRRLERDAGPHVQLLGHHAVKPQAGPDGRKGAQRVSGGGLFSISEAPIEATRLDDARALLRPLSWKHHAAPAPLVLRLEVEHGLVRRVLGEEFAPGEIGPVPNEAQRVYAAVIAAPGQSSTAISRRLELRKATTIGVLEDLERAGRVQGVKEGRSRAWHPCVRPSS